MKSKKFFFLSLNLFSFLKLVQGQPVMVGRSTIFTVSSELKERERINKLSKKIEKKEKRLELLAQTSRKSFAEKEKFQVKKKKVEEEIIKAQDVMVAEEKTKSKEELVRDVEKMYDFLISQLNIFCRIQETFSQTGKATPALIEQLGRVYLQTPAKLFIENS